MYILINNKEVNMKIIFQLTTNEGVALQGFENDLRELVINGVVIVSNGNMDTTQMEEVMELSQLNNLRLPNGDLN
tara:strand:- start:231 stop:455 length:225 start_codon:yes stop_codon:yes gene_type:complete